VFFFVAALWAYYHLVKQHYGFMVLYKKKNGDLAAVDNGLDRLLLLFAFNYPFVAFIAGDPEAMARVPGVLHGGVNGFATLLLAGTIVLAVLWLGRQVQRAITGEPLNIPKYLLLGAAIPMHWIVLLTPMPHKPIAIVAILTIYHNLQYQRLIWFHNQKYNQTSKAGVAVPEKYGAAALISRRLINYIGFGVLCGIIYQGPRQLLGYLSLRDAGAVPTDYSFYTQLGISFLWGYAFIHITRFRTGVRRDPSSGRPCTWHSLISDFDF
jgi:hypothetical protein